MTNESGENMPLLAHFRELRRCLIISGIALAVGFGLALPFYEVIVDFLMNPLLGIAGTEDGEVLFINTIAEGFLVRLKLSVLAGFIISSPVHLVNILSFVLPGLLKKEKKILMIFLAASLLLVVGSFLYSYATIIPVSVVFLTGAGFIPEDTGMLLSYSSNIFYILQFILMTVVVFQLPIILEILLVLNVVKRKDLFRFGRYVIVLFFLISALLTPPDFITQIGLALPMTVLYYLTLLVARIFGFGEDRCSVSEYRKSSSSPSSP